MLLQGAFYPNVHPLRLLFSAHHRRLSAAASDAWASKAAATAFLLSPSRISHLRDILTPLIAFYTLRRLPGPDQALHFFELTRSAFGVDHLVSTHYYLVAYLLKSGRREAALKLFDEMTRCGHVPDGSFFGFLIESLIECGDLDAVLALLARAPEFQCTVRSYTCNNLLNALVARNRIGDALDFFKNHSRSQFFAVDSCTFNVLLKGLCKVGDVGRAFELFREMRDFACLPDTITHNILIDGLCRAKKIESASEVLRRMQDDASCMPNVVTYTSVISGYCKMGKMEEALDVFGAMIACGIKPSTVTYNVLIDGYGKAGDMPSAVLMYERMMDRGCPPDVVTFTSLIDGYCRRGQLEDAMKLWHEMGERNLCPNVYTFATVINALCKKNRLSEARALLNELNGRKDIVPRTFMYNPVIDGFCKAGNVDEANSIMREMEGRSCSPDKLTYTILIIGHCMKGRMAEAIALFQKMLATGCAPDDITVRSFISCLLKAGMPNEVNRIVLMATGKDSVLDESSSKNFFSSSRKNMDVSVSV